jgi:uncharacterized protein YbbC (DUF1343 family)
MQTRTGLDCLVEQDFKPVRGERLGLIAHPASVDSRFRHAIDLFLEHPRANLVALFGPQHGARGETQDNMIEWQDYRDPRTGLPFYSLYGKTRIPTEEMLEEVDTLIFDLQDVGARYYTYIYTMALAMEACARLEKRFLVLDRPNPLNGVIVEGNILDPVFRSFVGMYPLAVRHGMTAGELACLFDELENYRLNLSVIGLEDWNRDAFFGETGLPWVLPSPNIPSFDTALVYPGMCLMEGTNVSEGRGTTLPFEISGAPWIDPYELLEILQPLDLPGVLFRPLHFVPTFHKWANQLVGGVQIHVLDPIDFKPFLTGLALVMAYRALGEERFKWREPPYEYEYELRPFDILCGTDSIRLLIENGSSLSEIESTWQEELLEFRRTRESSLLY